MFYQLRQPLTFITGDGRIKATQYSTERGVTKISAGSSFALSFARGSFLLAPCSLLLQLVPDRFSV